MTPWVSLSFRNGCHHATSIQTRTFQNAIFRKTTRILTHSRLLQEQDETTAVQDDTSGQDDDNFASCADGQENHICFHGGECVPILENDQYHCDCSNAKDGNGTVYVGKWCHLSPEIYCDDQHARFCVNGGTCSNSDETAACDCPNDFVGNHCEYRKGDVTFVEQNESGGGNEPTAEASDNKPEACPLDCQNGGVCIFNAPNSYVCQCPEGVSGARCQETQVLETPCGPYGNVCQHGSTCIRTVDGKYACDCTTISNNHDFAGSISVGTNFAGRWCEYEATSYCDADHQFFCVNGGACVEGDADGNGAFSCSCDEVQWTGPFCEFPAYDKVALRNCTVVCLNGGECRKDVEVDENNGSMSSQEHDYCACPKGYAGTSCEHQYQECGNGEHYCLHGSTCVSPKDSSKDEWSCACQDASSGEEHFYAGKFCQHHSTMVCTDQSSANDPYDPTLVAFCVNDGICVSIEENGETRPGCRCPPGYTGKHCELYDRARGSPYSNKGQESAVILFVCLVLGVLLVFLILVVVLRWRGLKRREEKHVADRITSSHMQEINTRQSERMEEMDFDPDFDEKDLEEVELL
jgi:hypothetical protein